MLSLHHLKKLVQNDSSKIRAKFNTIALRNKQRNILLPLRDIRSVLVGGSTSSLSKDLMQLVRQNVITREQAHEMMQPHSGIGASTTNAISLLSDDEGEAAAPAPSSTKAKTVKRSPYFKHLHTPPAASSLTHKRKATTVKRNPIVLLPERQHRAFVAQRPDLRWDRVAEIRAVFKQQASRWGIPVFVSLDSAVAWIDQKKKLKGRCSHVVSGV